MRVRPVLTSVCLALGLWSCTRGASRADDGARRRYDDLSAGVRRRIGLDQRGSPGGGHEGRRSELVPTRAALEGRRRVPHLPSLGAGPRDPQRLGVPVLSPSPDGELLEGLHPGAMPVVPPQRGARGVLHDLSRCAARAPVRPAPDPYERLARSAHALAHLSPRTPRGTRVPDVPPGSTSPDRDADLRKLPRSASRAECGLLHMPRGASTERARSQRACELQRIRLPRGGQGRVHRLDAAGVPAVSPGPGRARGRPGLCLLPPGGASLMSGARMRATALVPVMVVALLAAGAGGGRASRPRVFPRPRCA